MEDEVEKKKKYYWLRLDRNFFKRHDIRIIEGKENGKEFVLFYMKLLLESIDHEGNLRCKDTIPYDNEMLSTITNTDIGIVDKAMESLKKLDLINILDDETIYIPDTLKMLGEARSNDRVKRYREKKKEENNANETDRKRYSNVTVTESVTKIELEKELELEKAIALEKHFHNTVVVIVDYLNEKANTSYKPTTKKTKEFIKARMNESFKVDDFKKVIDIKCSKWVGTDMDKYLRPETLFGNKFEGYLNEKATVNKNKNKFNEIPKSKYGDMEQLEKEILAN